MTPKTSVSPGSLNVRLLLIFLFGAFVVPLVGMGENYVFDYGANWGKALAGGFYTVAVAMFGGAMIHPHGKLE